MLLWPSNKGMPLQFSLKREVGVVLISVKLDSSKIKNGSLLKMQKMKNCITKNAIKVNDL